MKENETGIGGASGGGGGVSIGGVNLKMKTTSNLDYTSFITI